MDDMLKEDSESTHGVLRLNHEEMKIESKDFFEANRKDIGEVVKSGGHVVNLDFQEFSEHSPTLSEKLIERPEETINLLEESLEELEWAPKKARIRFDSISPSQESLIRTIRAKHLGKMIGIEGIVRQASEVRPLVTNAKFSCPSCETIISVLQIDKKFKEPSRCSCGRRGGFKLLTKDMVDAQVLTIEEASDNLSGGEQPKRMTVFLKEDLVDPRMELRTTPGSRVKIIGILKEIALTSSSGAMLTRFDLAIEANNIIPMDESYEEVNVDEEDERAIRELAADPDIVRRMVQSIAPSIYGHDSVKRALTFQLFGGVKKTRSDGTKMRGSIHILLVGDPGVAKSVMLSFIANIAPKARYVSGKSASGAGLTATVVKDELLRGWSLEAGAMVLANKGLVAIDEFDKMDEEDRSSMHEAMEQQCMMPDFKLMLASGQSVKIGEFVDNLMSKNKKKVYAGIDCEILPVDNVELISTDFLNHFPIKTSRVSRHIAPSHFTKINLTNGREISVTPEHPCWVVENGKLKTIPAEKMKEGMFFTIPSEIKINSIRYKKEYDDLCKILGYHISDGCYELNRGKKNGIQFWNNDINLIEDYKNAIENYFNKEVGIVKRGKQFAARVISKKIVEKLNSLDSNLLEKGDKKKIPEIVMSFSDKNIKCLLRSLYDGDGSVVFQKRGGARIDFVSQNKELEEQISDLLLRFGILSSIFHDNHSKVWRLDISGQGNLSKFFINIGFLSKKKQNRLRNCLEIDKTYRTIRDVIPNCTDKINEIFKKLEISCRKEIGHSIDMGVEKQRIFLQKLINIAEKKLLLKKNDGERVEKIERDLNEMKKLAFGYCRFMKVKSVKKIKNSGTKWVYDVTVEPYHTFISNGMVLHNTVTISKATVQATLRAQTSVLAAANPKFGRFDPTQPIPKQVNLVPSLLSRFDAIFIMRDIPSKTRDTNIALHVLKEHQQEAKHEVIEEALMRKYISYAKQKYNPVLTDEAVMEMKDFYVGLRSQAYDDNSAIKAIPIGARQLEALVRLSEAHARIRLSKEVKTQDAKAAIDLMRGYLMEVGFDEETQKIDIDKISGNSASKRSKIIVVREAVESLENKFGKLIPMEEVEKTLENQITQSELEEAIDRLVKSGDIFKPKRGYIQRM